jgi:flagellar hook-associated protein 3 FlgL
MSFGHALPLATYATEVSQLIQQGVQLMNSTWQGSHIFGGTQNTQPPFVATTDANGNVTGVTYQGNESVPSAEIAAGATIPAQVPGVNSSGTGLGGIITDTRNGADFFNHLIALQNHLRAGDTASIASQDRPGMSQDEDNITSHIASNGLIQSHLAAVDAVSATQSLSVEQTVSQASDVDLVETLTQVECDANRLPGSIAERSPAPESEPIAAELPAVIAASTRVPPARA